MVRMLLKKHGADVNAADNEGKSALFRALHNIRWFDYLIEKGANLVHVDKAGQIALYYASLDEFCDDEVKMRLKKCCYIAGWRVSARKRQTLQLQGAKRLIKDRR